MVEGELLLGRFTVGERIGRGGHGTVHRARDERLCRGVAIKAIEGEAAGRVIREAHAAARLNHTGIVTLYELGEQGGNTYLVTELVQGPNLRRLAASGRLSDREVAEIGAELCCALAHAHAQGVIHRDIKPDNVLIRGGPHKRTRAVADRAMLADFGIADIADEPSLTATGQAVGTLAYMAPEQAAGEAATPAVDIYALALMLYEIWTGVNPVAGDNPAATARAIGTELPGLAERRPELPTTLCETIDAALDPDPERRPELTRLRAVLERCAGGLHPDRAVPEPEVSASFSTLPSELPLRPFAVICAAGLIAATGLLAGLPGLALVAAALLVPAALTLDSPSEWIRPALAPLLGLVGAAPVYLLVAASHARTEARIALAALGWAWTVVAGSVLGLRLGVVGAASAPGWEGSGPVAIERVLAPLASPDAIAVGLVWIGFTLLAGVILELTSSATGMLATMVWAAGLVAVLGAIGGPASPGLALTVFLVIAVGILHWDRAGRPGLVDGGPLEGFLALGHKLSAAGDRRPPPPAATAIPLPPPAPPPAADVRARRAADRHLRAALHQSPPPARPRDGSPRRKRSRIKASA
ncbi:MAG: protein kinase domain-containing protein [Solirubrobacterales bacterium]